eukprot:1315439-Alexandrium_andersonii.AAC.1
MLSLASKDPRKEFRELLRGGYRSPGPPHRLAPPARAASPGGPPPPLDPPDWRFRHAGGASRG